MEGLLERGEPVHFAAVAASLRVPPDRMADSEAFRALVEEASRRAREQWRERLRAQLTAARDRLKAKGARLSRANLAAEVGITLDLLATYEREGRDSFAVSPSEEYPARVRAAVAALQARRERVTTAAVSRELGRDRGLLEKHPELKGIVAEARQPAPTVEDVRRACRELRARGEQVSVVAVARVLRVGRHVIERLPTLGAEVRGG